MYDVIVIGAGWAGINAAIASAELGFKTALVEKDKLGGLCLNWGCIPAKTYLYSARLSSLIKEANNFAIDVKDACLSFPNLYNRKNEIINTLYKGLEFNLRSKNIDLFFGAGRLESKNEVAVGGKTLKAKNIILAVGSSPLSLKGLNFDKEKIINSSDILDLKTLPNTLLIVGGGAIGCEFAWIFSKFNTRITLVEQKDRLLFSEDIEVSKKVELNFKKMGIDVNTGSDISKFNLDNFDKVLICVGRTPNFKDLNIKSVFTANKVEVNEYLQTPTPNIYLAGDAVGKFMFANAASYLGRLCVKNIYNQKQRKPKEKVNYNLIPKCIFLYPEIASVGLVLDEGLKQANFDYEVKKITLKANGLSHILGEYSGFIKIFIEKKSKRLLGAVVFSPYASEIINIFTAALYFKSKFSDLKNLVFTHPSISEAISDVE